MKEKIETLYTLKLQKIEQEAKQTYTFTFPKPDDFSWQEGACVHLGNSNFDKEKGKANKPFVRHLSIVSLPAEKNLRFTTRIPDPCSDFKKDLSQAKIGDTFTLFKPENRLQLKREDRPIVLISAGVGIAATRSMLRAFSISPEKIPTLHHINIDSSGEYLYQDEINQYVNDSKGLSNVFVSSRGELYKELESSFINDAIYYIVGSDAFLLDIGKWLMQKGITIPSIILDKNIIFYEELSEAAGNI